MASRSVRGNREQVLQPLPLLIAEWPQPHHLLSRRGLESSGRTLGGSPSHMSPFGSRLMSAPEARPPEMPGLLLLGLPEQMQQATHLRHTQFNGLLVTSRFFSWARVTTRTAWASKARVMWRYQAR
jgi:hypothetical protein